MENNIAQRVMSLDGTWSIVKDTGNIGKQMEWYRHYPDEEVADVPVPGIVQQVFHDHHGVSWYRRIFDMNHIEQGLRYFVCFDAVDYYADVYINGFLAGSHEGEEIPFEFEVSDFVKETGNELIVRIINPVDDVTIDGLNFTEIPRSNHAVRGYSPGGGLNQGGITRNVRLTARPDIYISDVFAYADPKTGIIELDVETDGTGDGISAVISAVCTGMDCPVASNRTAVNVTARAGKSRHKFTIPIVGHRLWDIDDPYLYNLTLTVKPESSTETQEDTYRLRIGFREFCVKNGYFMLNGRRIFLKSSHTGNHVPIGNSYPVDPDLMRRDLILMKSVGFNCIRYISSNALPAQLDFCDELGLLVYEESRASWMLQDTPRMAEHYDRSTGRTIMRDRSHACVGIWGLLNENYNDAIYRHARDFLPKLREIDPTRLVLLSSGRWDLELSTGSLSNPFSGKWEYEWCDERPDNPGPKNKDAASWIQLVPMTPLVPGAGDTHSYPKIPFSDEVVDGYLTLGKNVKPVFLSETGAGSQYNSPGELRRFEQAGASELLPDRIFIKSMADRYEQDFIRYGLEDVYPYSEDFYFDSQRHQARNRRFIFNLIRGNAQICGYNVTGLLDHAMAGEGLWSFWREFKPGMMDVLEGGFAKLRMCLFVRPFHVYAHKPFRVFAAAANEDELKCGSYPVNIRIHRAGGTVWEKNVTLTIPESTPDKPAPLAYTLFDGDVTLPCGCEAGIYTLSADIEGAHARDRQIEFTVSDSKNLPKIKADIIGVGLDAASVVLLNESGITVGELKESSGHVALVSAVKDDEEWEELLQLARDGGHVVFMNAELFGGSESFTSRIGFDADIKISDDWLYHKDNVIKPSILAEGLDKPGVMDLGYYDRVFGHYVYENIKSPDKTLVAAFATCYPIPSGYTSYVVTGSYYFGNGMITLNTLDICQNIGHPAADRLLLNIVSYAAQ